MGNDFTKDRDTDRPVLAVELPDRPATESSPATTAEPVPAAGPDRPAAESTPAPTAGPAPVPHGAERPVPTDAQATAVDATTESTQPPAPSSPVTPLRKPRRVTWAAVEKAVKAKAADLRKCSSDDYISLGLKISGGRAEPPLRFADGELVGVVGVPLD